MGAYILKNKSQLRNNYGSWCSNQSIWFLNPLGPIIMWTDNGGENNGIKMLRFLQTNRIYPHFIFPRNPQQNGKIESFWKKIDKNCKLFIYLIKWFLRDELQPIEIKVRERKPTEPFLLQFIYQFYF